MTKSRFTPGARRALLAAMALPALLAAAGYSISVSAKTLVFCSEGSPENFYPAVNTTGTSFDANSQIYSRIVDFERGGTAVARSGGRAEPPRGGGDGTARRSGVSLRGGMVRADQFTGAAVHARELWPIRAYSSKRARHTHIFAGTRRIRTRVSVRRRASVAASGF